MNKICGYSCKHNKGGTCQISSCDRRVTLSTTTQNYVQIIEGTTMYYEWYVKLLQQELQRKDNIINELEKWLKYEIYCDFNKEMTKAYQHSLDELNELRGK